MIQKDKMPHMLFYGPPGTGKTSMILALAKDFYGQSYRKYILELNASDDRGIDVVRNQIKSFAETLSFGQSKKIKVIILDEMDNMTSVAQMALRRIIENYVSNVRFCLICNHVNKVIPALQSRCTRFKFKPLPTHYVQNKLQLVSAGEHINIDDATLGHLADASQGDMRKGMNVLQSALLLKDTQKVEVEDIYLLTGVIHTAMIENIFNIIMNNNYSTAFRLVDNLVKTYNVSINNLISKLGDKALSLNINVNQKIKLISILAECEVKANKMNSNKMLLMNIIGAFVAIKV
eukprot:Mrub_06285.p1 GENE.Mrub_06285~~Mrub_06285.p1  ORF type:complete len:326 (+),score=46.12 Mrub_06285:107-979(+)